ncbi:MAG: response regulator [Planctomycetes bacterium]|nr:response regulator [Planctomycetota bacterium]
MPLRLKARAAASASGRQVQVDSNGEELACSRGLVDALYPPLLTLVRHIIERRLEQAPERQRVGKPEHGTIVLDARHDAGHLGFSIGDDGGGLGSARCALAGVDSAALLRSLSADLAGHPLSDDQIAAWKAQRPTVRIEERLGRDTTFHLSVPTAVVSVVTAAGAPPTAARAVRVLFVDDSLMVRKAAEKFLRALGAEVSIAIHGEDGLAQLGARSFDLVLTDLEMPRMTGYELIERLRQMPTCAAVPVVVVTSRSGENYREQAVMHGANDYITKPFNQETFAHLLHKWVGAGSLVA